MPVPKKCSFCSKFEYNTVSVNTKVLSHHLLTTIIKVTGREVTAEQADNLLICEECALATVQADIIANKLNSLFNIHKSYKTDKYLDAFAVIGSKPSNKDRPKTQRKRNFPCSYCDLRFTCSYNLKIHLTTHTGDPLPFVCSVDNCNKRFAYPAEAKTHELSIHAKETPHECTSCGKAFGFKHSLQKHMKFCSALNRTFECGNCGKKFREEDKYDAHAAKSTCVSKYIDCLYDSCRKRFTKKSNLRRHMITIHHIKP